MKEDSNALVAAAIKATLISPNVSDSNWESANVVDTLNQIAQANMEIAKAILELAKAVKEISTTLSVKNIMEDKP